MFFSFERNQPPPHTPPNPFPPPIPHSPHLYQRLYQPRVDLQSGIASWHRVIGPPQLHTRGAQPQVEFHVVEGVGGVHLDQSQGGQVASGAIPSLARLPLPANLPRVCQVSTLRTPEFVRIKDLRLLERGKDGCVHLFFFLPISVLKSSSSCRRTAVREWLRSKKRSKSTEEFRGPNPGE